MLALGVDGGLVSDSCVPLGCILRSARCSLWDKHLLTSSDKIPQGLRLRESGETQNPAVRGKGRGETGMGFDLRVLIWLRPWQNDYVAGVFWQDDKSRSLQQEYKKKLHVKLKHANSVAQSYA